MTLADYRADFRAGWKALAAASLGLGAGLGLLPFVMNVLAPHIVSDLGWSKSDFAMVSMVSGLTLLTYPAAGRLADRFGVKRIASIGIIASSIGYAALAALEGSIGYYAGFLVFQLTLGAMISGPVLLRLVVHSFDRSRGMALAIAVSTPALLASLASPLFAALIEAQGWRTGSLTVAGFVLMLGSVAVALAPREDAARSSPGDGAALPHSAPPLASLLAQPKLWLLIVMTLLVSMPLVLSNSQLAMVLVENGMAAGTAGSVIGLFAAGTLGGRLAAGIALDKFAAEKVGAIVLSLPAAGMLLLASPLDHGALLALAVFIIGLAFGAEGDILAYIASKHFDLASYGTIVGMLFGIAGASGMIGALVLGQTLRISGGYDLFLIFGSASVLLGSLLILKLPQPAGELLGAKARRT